jgi:hypothetical protein
LLFNGLGRYEDALVAARQAGMFPTELCAANWGLADLVESAARTGATEDAAGALEQLSAMTQASGTDWALGVESRSRALLSEGDAAERLYREAIERLGRTRARAELAGPACSTGNGCAASVDASTRASSCGRLTSCSARSAPRGSANGLVASCWLPGRRRASAAPIPAKNSQPRRRRSPGSPRVGGRTRRSAPSCSSALAPWSGTWARCSPGSASVLGRSCVRLCRRGSRNFGPTAYRCGSNSRLPSPTALPAHGGRLAGVTSKPFRRDGVTLLSQVTS